MPARPPQIREIGFDRRMTDVLGAVAERILALRLDHPVRVGVDGRTAAGKTTFAASLSSLLRQRSDREVIHVGLDYFKRHMALRTAYAVQSAASYYLDTWDYPAIRALLLEPLGPGGSRRYREKIMNLPGTEAIEEPERVAAIAADLGVEAHAVQKLIEAHVRGHLAELAEIRAEFR